MDMMKSTMHASVLIANKELKFCDPGLNKYCCKMNEFSYTRFEMDSRLRGNDKWDLF